MSRIQVGQPAPIFEARDHSGALFRLADKRGRCVVLFFYPKDGTPICTAQACGFRDAHSELQRLGAVVVGCSPDSDHSHAAMVSNHALPFALLSDPQRRIARLFGVTGWLGILPARATFVIGPSGLVVAACRARWRASPHAALALATVRRSKEQGAANGAAP